MRVLLNTSELKRIKREAPAAFRQIPQKLAQDMQGDSVDNMNTVSPAPAGQAPGVDTGTLKNNIVAEPGNDNDWFWRAYTDYAVHLEYGTVRMAARPFGLPSFRRVMGRVPGELKAVL